MVSTDFAFRKSVSLRLEIVVLHLRLDGRGCSEIQRPKNWIHDVTGPVAHGAVAEGDPAAPFRWQVRWMIGPILRWPQPHIPIQRRRNLVLLAQMGQFVDAGVHCRASCMNGVDAADGAIPYPFTTIADRIKRVALIAQLGDHLVFLRGLHQFADLVHRVGQRFFAINVLAALDGGHRRHGVTMVRRGDHDRINLLFHRIEQFAKIAELFGGGKFPERLGGLLGVHVAQRDDVVIGGDRINIAGAHAADANAGDVQLLAGRSLAAAGQDVAWHNRERRYGGSRSAHEGAAGQGA